MQITAENLEVLFKGFKGAFNDAFKGAPTHYERVAMTVGSKTRENVYAWLGQFLGLREWVGDRIIKELNIHGFAIKNRKFESTITITRDDISDDQYGVYGPLFSEMGRIAKTHPDELVFGLLGQGFETDCYDGQPFFDTDHPSYDEEGNQIATVSNLQPGGGAAWFLLDTSREIKPLIWQAREAYELQIMDDARSERVFMRDEYLYGVRGRANAGFGLWQLAFGSRAELDAENYKLARATMASFTGDRNRPMGITPNLLVVSPALEEQALTLIKAEQISGTSNIWKDTVELLVSPYLAN